MIICILEYNKSYGLTHFPQVFSNNRTIIARSDRANPRPRSLSQHKEHDDSSAPHVPAGELHKCADLMPAAPLWAQHCGFAPVRELGDPP
jgi:hypothetical protein